MKRGFHEEKYQYSMLRVILEITKPQMILHTPNPLNAKATELNANPLVAIISMIDNCLNCIFFVRMDFWTTENDPIIKTMEKILRILDKSSFPKKFDKCGEITNNMKEEKKPKQRLLTNAVERCLSDRLLRCTIAAESPSSLRTRRKFVMAKVKPTVPKSFGAKILAR